MTPTRPWVAHVRLTALFAVATAAACHRGPAAAASAASWTVDSVPQLAIGVAEGDTLLEFDRANSALQLADGRVAVANTATAQIRFFDSAGAFVSAAGRRGQGPGEYSGALTLYRAEADSLIVYDGGNQRFSVVDSAGRFARVLKIESPSVSNFPWDDWLASGAWVRGVRNRQLRPCVEGLLARLGPPPPPAPVRDVRVDPQHAVWIRDPRVSAEGPGGSRWAVYSLDGREVGRTQLPAGLEPFEFGRGYVLGRWRTTDGIEFIRRYALHRTGPAELPAGCTAPTETPAQGSGTSSGSVAMPPLLAALRNAIVAQEMYYAQHGAYAGERDTLSWSSPSGARLWVVRGDRRGWAGVLLPADGGHICGVGIGDDAPPGWAEGAPICH